MEKYELLAKDIYDFCIKRELWQDITIFFNGKAWGDPNPCNYKRGKRIDKDLYEYKNMNPVDYFKYVNPDTLSMSFEGPLYYILNGYVYGPEMAEFIALFEKYGLYYELGDAWNLTAYED